MELKLPSDLQMMVLTRPLLELLERETFEHYTESTQTHIDISTPEEMRWLAMFPKVTLVLPKSIRGRFGASSVHRDAGSRRIQRHQQYAWSLGG